MKKIFMIALVLALAAGAVYAAEATKDKYAPVSTVVTDTGEVVKTAAEGTVETLDLNNNPIVTATETTVKVAEGTVKTATFQKIDKTTGK